MSRIDSAVLLVEQWGGIGGEHHVRWLLDQVLRTLLADGYDAWLLERNLNTDYTPWDQGIAP